MEALDKLFMQATGGVAVAADPSSPLDDYWPRARNAAGVDVLVSWFKSRSSSNVRTFLFLVGGPGGGKSHVSAKMVSDYKEISPKSTNLAQRSHLFDSGNGEVLLVNDATIDEIGSQRGSLATEIDDCINLNRSLIACINRGILVEELSKVQNSESTQGILSWLANESTTGIYNFQALQESSYLKTARFTSLEGNNFELAVAYVDACSLFEENPSPTFDENAGFETAFSLPQYKLTKWTRRSLIDPKSMPGLDLINSAVQKVGEDLGIPESVATRNPIHANVRNLQNLPTVRKICDLLRAAEISSGQRFTYREVWGIISRLISGDLSKMLTAEEVPQYLASLEPESHNSANEAFAKFQQLSSVRLSQGLFGIEDSGLFAPRNSAHPITSLLANSDPVRDGEPGTYSSSEVDTGWVTPVLDAFAGSIAGDSPLTLLISQVRAIDGDNFSENVSDFDRALDQAFVEFTSQPKIKDDDRNAAINWYSTYLSRLYGVLNGIPAFLPQTASWIEVWLSSPSVPNSVEQKLLTLLRPRRTDLKEDNSFIPLFDSRTVPVTELAADAKLVAKLVGIKTKTRVDGDSVILSIEEQGTTVADILFDFPLLRDSLSCTEDHVGATDVSALTAPRLERLRASRLAPQMRGNTLQISVIEGYKSSEVIVS